MGHDSMAVVTTLQKTRQTVVLGPCHIFGVLFDTVLFHSVQFNSVQFRSRWYLCARKSPYAHHPVSQKFPQRCHWDGFNVRLIDDGRLSSFQGRSSSSSSFHVSLLQAIDGVMSLALCPQVVSQTSQHFRSSEKQATCEGCFACQCICLAISPHSSMSRAVHPQEFSKVDVNHWLILKCQVLKSTHGLSPASLSSQVRYQCSCQCNFPSLTAGDISGRG